MMIPNEKLKIIIEGITDLSLSEICFKGKFLLKEITKEYSFIKSTFEQCSRELRPQIEILKSYLRSFFEIVNYSITTENLDKYYLLFIPSYIDFLQKHILEFENLGDSSSNLKELAVIILNWIYNLYYITFETLFIPKFILTMEK